jgi:hypothetical protein
MGVTESGRFTCQSRGAPTAASARSTPANRAKHKIDANEKTRAFIDTPSLALFILKSELEIEVAKSP